MGILRMLFGFFRSADSGPGDSARTQPAAREEPPWGPALACRQELRVVSIRPAPEYTVDTVLQGPCYVVDGDTIVIERQTIRIAGIDAPELDHPWGKRAKWALFELCRGQIVTAAMTGELSHDRIVARCSLPDGRDLAAEMVRLGLALDWAKHSGGRYRYLEPPGIRMKLWRADARQKGRFPGDSGT